MAKQTVEEVIQEIEGRIADIEAFILKSSENRAEDLQATQNALQLFKSQFDDVQGQLDTVNERLKRLEARNR